MLGELPELNDFFNSKPKSTGKTQNSSENETHIKKSDIKIQISKGDGVWLPLHFLDFAVAQIGIHVMLPVQIDFTSSDLKNLTIRFVSTENNTENILLDVPVLARWQEKDSVSGKLKLGLHFHKEIKDDITLKEILSQIG